MHLRSIWFALVLSRSWSLLCLLCWPTGDGLLDLAVANSQGVNFLYHNEGGGTFTKVTTGPVMMDTGFSRAVAWGDYDGVPPSTHPTATHLYLQYSKRKPYLVQGGDRPLRAEGWGVP